MDDMEGGARPLIGGIRMDGTNGGYVNTCFERIRGRSFWFMIVEELLWA